MGKYLLFHLPIRIKPQFIRQKLRSIPKKTRIERNRSSHKFDKFQKCIFGSNRSIKIENSNSHIPQK